LQRPAAVKGAPRFRRGGAYPWRRGPLRKPGRGRKRPGAQGCKTSV